MSKLVVYMSMSLDGYIAAEGDDSFGLGLGVGGEPLHAWLTNGNLQPGSFRPESGVNAEIFDEMLASGAVMVGKRAFELAGEWGGDHHDGVPIFVLTRHVPSDPVRGHIHYLSDVEDAVAQAKQAAGEKDVMMHGAASVQAVLELGLVDELAITVAPVLLGRGRRLFENLPPKTCHLRLTRSQTGDGAVHLRYQIRGGPGPRTS